MFALAEPAADFDYLITGNIFMKLLFCLPGNNFSEHYFHSWNNTIQVMAQHDIEWAYSMSYDPVVYYTRNKILGGNNNLGRVQKPFQGTVPYDYMIWIDSDMVWNGADVMKLISHNMDVVSGCYVTHDNMHYPIVETLDYQLLRKQGTFQFLNRQDLETRNQPFRVSYVGFGFVAIKFGVFESMTYPWFQPRFVEYENFYDFTAEDVGFCWTCAENNIPIWVDPSVRVGHEKKIVLSG